MGEPAGEIFEGRRGRYRVHFDEPVLPQHVARVENPNTFYGKYTILDDHSKKRWATEQKAQVRCDEPRSRSLSPMFRPSADEGEYLSRPEKRRTHYFSKPGHCHYCNRDVCMCFMVTYGDSDVDLRVTHKMWERVPYGCLQMQQATFMASDPGLGWVKYRKDPFLSLFPEEVEHPVVVEDMQ